MAKRTSADSAAFSGSTAALLLAGRGRHLAARRTRSRPNVRGLSSNSGAIQTGKLCEYKLLLHYIYTSQDECEYKLRLHYVYTSASTRVGKS